MIARQDQAIFEEYLRNNPHANPGTELTVTVLTAGFWPNFKYSGLNLPAEMVIILIIMVALCGHSVQLFY